MSIAQPVQPYCYAENYLLRCIGTLSVTKQWLCSKAVPVKVSAQPLVLSGSQSSGRA